MAEQLNEAGLRYLKCLIDPWNAEPSPNLYECSLPTNLKVVTKTFHTNVLGQGMVSVGPQYTIASDLNHILYSTGAVSIDKIYDTITTGVAGMAITSNPYKSGDYGLNTRMYRLVACALKVKYAGISEFIGGEVIGMMGPFGYNLANYTFQMMDQYEYTKPTDFTNQEYCVFWTPTLPEACAKWRYNIYTPADMEEAGYNKSKTLGILIKSSDTTNTVKIPIEVSVATVYEVAGSKERNTRFRHSQRDQYEKVMNLLNTNRTWIGSPSTLLMNLASGGCCQGLRASTVGQRVYQDIPLFYAIDGENTKVPLKDESGEVLAIVNKKSAKEFVTGEKEVYDTKEDEEAVGGFQVFKGAKTKQIEDPETDPVTTLGELYGQNMPVTDKRIKKKRRNSSDNTINEMFSNQTDRIKNIIDSNNFWSSLS